MAFFLWMGTLVPSNDQQINNLYLTEPNAGIVQIVDLKARALASTISVGGNPRRVAFSSKGDMGVVTNLNGYLSFIK
jgi:DNA-binding beta-propeller fold protein YncE